MKGRAVHININLGLAYLGERHINTTQHTTAFPPKSESYSAMHEVALE